MEQSVVQFFNENLQGAMSFSHARCRNEVGARRRSGGSQQESSRCTSLGGEQPDSLYGWHEPLGGLYARYVERPFIWRIHECNRRASESADVPVVLLQLHGLSVQNNILKLLIFFSCNTRTNFSFILIQVFKSDEGNYSKLLFSVVRQVVCAAAGCGGAPRGDRCDSGQQPTERRSHLGLGVLGLPVAGPARSAGCSDLHADRYYYGAKQVKGNYVNQQHLGQDGHARVSWIVDAIK